MGGLEEHRYQQPGQKAAFVQLKGGRVGATLASKDKPSAAVSELTEVGGSAHVNMEDGEQVTQQRDGNPSRS